MIAQTARSNKISLLLTEQGTYIRLQLTFISCSLKEWGKEMSQEQGLTTIVTSTALDVAIGGWLHAHQRSERTQTAYRDTLLHFRASLHDRGLDLDTLATDEEVAQVAMIAQAFASYSARNKQVKASTINQRLASISSFYEYARIKKAVRVNPLTEGHVKREKVQAYASARALDADTTSAAFASIDRSTLSGLRDYALLCVLLQTGRRLQEVASLQMQHLTIRKGRVTVSFEHCKGDKQMRDTLPLPVTKALVSWLHAQYGASIRLGTPGDERPVWVSLSRGGKSGKSEGKHLGTQAIADICQKHLGTSKVHAMRHTFAHLMEKAGASVSEIQAHLGHESLATTGHYLAQLKQEENKYADDLAAMLGIK
jgi:site-specific recombinase XerD